MFRKHLIGALNLLTHQATHNQTRIVPRLFSTANNLETVHYDDLERLLKTREAVLIDVREPEELQEHGRIPNAINIPLGQVEAALKHMSEAEFAKSFGVAKPTKETPIVFSCMKGVRSEKAQITALELQYKNVKNYAGGWVDWAGKHQNSH